MEGKFYFTNNSVLQWSWVAYYIIEYIESDQLLKSSLREHGWELVEENEGNVIKIK